MRHLSGDEVSLGIRPAALGDRGREEGTRVAGALFGDQAVSATTKITGVNADLEALLRRSLEVTRFAQNDIFDDYVPRGSTHR